MTARIASRCLMCFACFALLVRTGGLARAEPPDLSTPQGALHAYVLAVETGDAAGLKASLFNIDPEFIDAHCAGLASTRAVYELAASKFADSPRTKPPQAKPVEALAAQAEQDYEALAKLPMRVKGDDAFVALPRRGDVKLRKVDGQWKVDGDVMFIDPSAENRRRDLAIDRVLIPVHAEFLKDIAAGKYRSWAVAERAARIRIAAALAADPEYKAAEKARADAIARRLGSGQPAAPNAAAGNAAGAGAAGAGAAGAGRTGLLGGEGGNGFTRSDPAGRPVVGFRYSFGQWGGRQVMRQLDPLYEVPAAVPAGNAGGNAAGNAAARRLAAGQPVVKTVVARPGYVVGGLIVDADEVNAVAVRVIFVGFKDGRPDPKATYTTDWIGIPSGKHQGQLAGKGEKIIGTWGRQGLNLNAVGLVVAPPTGPAAAGAAAGAAQPASRPAAPPARR